MMSGDGGKGAMTVTNGLYTIQIEMRDGGHGRAHGVIVLREGKIAGGDLISITRAPIAPIMANGSAN